MAILLKDLYYSPKFYTKFANELSQIIPDFDSQSFISAIFDSHWESRELKDRMRHTAEVLHHFFPSDFKESASLILNLVQLVLGNPSKGDGFTYIFLADYIERFGINDIETSMALIEDVTQLSSCEFAVRPFIIKYPDQMISQMIRWSKHPNHHVRRLASEGIRPRLPWAMALPLFKKNPELIFPILENLKQDPSEYVRKSVANNLNDISKDNPDVVLAVIQRWKNCSAHTDWIIKHGCRTLLKQGHPKIFEFYKLSATENIEIADFKINPTILKIGEDLHFSFTIQNNDTKAHDLRLEYAIYYKRQNNSLSKKVFKISEKTIQSLDTFTIYKKQSFKIISTRKFYSGVQHISIIINGIEKQKLPFELVIT